MRQRNLMSKKVTLAQDVTAGQVISFSGHLATTGETDKEPAGVSLYAGKTGEIIAIMTIGYIDVATETALEVGNFVKATAGKVVKADNKADSFATVSEVNNATSVEIEIK